MGLFVCMCVCVGGVLSYIPKIYGFLCFFHVNNVCSITFSIYWRKFMMVGISRVWTIIMTCFHQFVVDKQPPEESSDHEEQEVGSSDSDYGSDGMESSNSSVVIEMEGESFITENTYTEYEVNRSIFINSVNKQATVAKEESSDSEEQEENSESGYSGRQQSESESSDDCVMQDDSTKLSQASSEDKNRPALNLNSSLSENLEGKIYM